MEWQTLKKAKNQRICGVCGRKFVGHHNARVCSDCKPTGIHQRVLNTVVSRYRTVEEICARLYAFDREDVKKELKRLLSEDRIRYDSVQNGYKKNKRC